MPGCGSAYRGNKFTRHKRHTVRGFEMSKSCFANLIDFIYSTYCPLSVGGSRIFGKGGLYDGAWCINRWAPSSMKHRSFQKIQLHVLIFGKVHKTIMFTCIIFWILNLTTCRDRNVGNESMCSLFSLQHSHFIVQTGPLPHYNKWSGYNYKLGGGINYHT